MRHDWSGGVRMVGMAHPDCLLWHFAKYEPGLRTMTRIEYAIVQTADALGTQMVSAPSSTSTKPLAAAGLELLQARIGHPAAGRTTECQGWKAQEINSSQSGRSTAINWPATLGSKI